MDLLEFARGPALTAALVIFVLGTLWRLIGVLRRPRIPDLSPPRAGASSNLTGPVRAIVRDMVADAQAASMIGYVTMGMSLVPMIGPVIGGFLDDLEGVR